MATEISSDRRRFLGAALTTFAAAPIMAGSAAAHFEVASQTERATRLEAKISSSSLKQIVAGVLNVGYAEDGPADGPGDQRADHHPRRGCERRAASGSAAYAAKFSGKYVHRNLTGGIGHNLPQEAPKAFAAAVIDVDAL